MPELTTLPKEKELAKSSAMYTYKQDPSFLTLGIRRTLVLSHVKPGPEDDLVRVVDGPVPTQDRNGNFLIKPNDQRTDTSPAEHAAFDAVHTFAVCRQVLTMYLRAFRRLGKIETQTDRTPIVRAEDMKDGQFDFVGKWGRPLRLYIRAYKDKLIALYTPGPNVNAIDFGYRDGVYACQSFDIVAHETGHAVLAAIWSGVKIKHSKERGALEEAFSDLTALFALLSHLDMCAIAIAYSKGNLDADFFLNTLAEEYGQKKNKRLALRDIGDPAYLSEIRNRDNRYSLSLIFSSAVYRLMVQIFNDFKKPDKYPLAETLLRAARFVTTITLGAFYLTANEEELTFEKVGRKMIQLLKKMKNRDVISNEDIRDDWAARLEEIFNEQGVLSK